MKAPVGSGASGRDKPLRQARVGRTSTILLLCSGYAAVNACASGQYQTPDDQIPPVVRIVYPEEGERVETPTPTIQVEYADDKSGVAAVSFRAEVNGRDYSVQFDHYRTGARAEIPTAMSLPLGKNHLVVEVADRAGNIGRAEVDFLNASGGWIKAVSAPGAEPERHVELVLDASGSMREAIGIASRMDVAKEAIGNLVESLPSGTPLGLRVFFGCDNIVSLVGIQPVNKSFFMDQVGTIEPSQGTPLVVSLSQSIEVLSQFRTGERIAVLVTDGGESCGGAMDSVLVHAADAATRVIVIGFDIAEAGLTAELRRFAESTGGSFFDARNPDELSRALERSVLRINYGVYDLENRLVADGAVNGDPIELPVGTYHVRIATSPPIILRDVEVGRLTETPVELRRGPSGLTAEVLALVPRVD